MEQKLGRLSLLNFSMHKLVMIFWFPRTVAEVKSSTGACDQLLMKRKNSDGIKLTRRNERKLRSLVKWKSRNLAIRQKHIGDNQAKFGGSTPISSFKFQYSSAADSCKKGNSGVSCYTRAPSMNPKHKNSEAWWLKHNLQLDCALSRQNMWRINYALKHWIFITIPQTYSSLSICHFIFLYYICYCCMSDALFYY